MHVWGPKEGAVYTFGPLIFAPHISVTLRFELNLEQSKHKTCQWKIITSAKLLLLNSVILRKANEMLNPHHAIVVDLLILIDF